MMNSNTNNDINDDNNNNTANYDVDDDDDDNDSNNDSNNDDDTERQLLNKISNDNSDNIIINDSSSNINSLRQTTYVISLYWIVSISTVYLNKFLLSNDDTSIPAPLFLTWFQCLTTCIICYLCGILGERHRMNGIKNSIYTEYPLVSFSSRHWRKGFDVLPLTVVFVLMITLNNVCLKYVTVSFYNIARSLSLVFNVIFIYLILGEKTSMTTCYTLLIVIFGFIIGIDGEVNFSFYGTLAGVFASLFVSLNSIYTSSVLPKVNNDKSLLLFYNNYNATLLFGPLIVLFESAIIISHFNKFFSLVFWIYMIISGIMGFLIGLVTVMQVKATSPLTHNISGTAKAAVQSLIAFYIWGNRATVNGLIGLFAILFGSALYTYVRMRKI